MKKEIKLSDITGKTVAGFEAATICTQAVMTFTDGTFVTLGIERGYNKGEEMIIGEPLDLFNFGDDTLIRVDVITRAELEEKRQARDRDIASDRATRERIEYERLKRKFES